MAYRGSSANRGNRRRRQASKRGSGSLRNVINDGLPLTSAATDVGETTPANTLSNMSPVATSDVKADENRQDTVDCIKGKEGLKEKSVSFTEQEDVFPIDGKSSVSHAATAHDEEQQTDVENSSHRRRSGRRARRSRRKSLFPKPPTCRTIQVSRGKNTIGFYFELAHKFLHDNEMIELSGVGMACPVVIHLAEMIFESRYAEKDHIHVSMMKETEDRIRTEPKARIQIWIQRSEIFFDLAAKDLQEENAVHDDKDTKRETSYDHGSTYDVHGTEAGYESGDANVGSCAKEVDNTFRDSTDQITSSAKAEDAKDYVWEDIDKKVRDISLTEKDEGHKVSSEKVKEGKLEGETVDAGNTDGEDVVNWKTDDGGKSYYGKLLEGQTILGDGFVIAKKDKEIQTFLARARDAIAAYASGSRSSSAQTPATDIRGAARAEFPTRSPTFASTTAPDGGGSAYYVVESGNGFHEARLSFAASHVDTSGRLDTHRTSGGESSTNFHSASGAASYPGRTTASTPDTRQSCVIDIAADVSAAMSADCKDPIGRDNRDLSRDPSKMAVAKSTTKPGDVKDGSKKAHPKNKGKRSTGRTL